MPETQRRAPAEPKDIDDIEPQNDIRVRIIGTVLSVDEDSLSVDDGSGTVEVFMDEEELKEIDENDRVRVLGRVLPTPDSFEIQGEVLQQFDIDAETYDTVKKVVNTTE